MHLSKRIRKIQRLEERVEVASGALVLEPDVSCLLLGIVVYEVVPQDTCLVLNKPDIGGDIGRVIFAQRAVAVFPGNVEHSPVFDEAGEAPVALLLGESVVSGMVHV